MKCEELRVSKPKFAKYQAQAHLHIDFMIPLAFAFGNEGCETDSPKDIKLMQ